MSLLYQIGRKPVIAAVRKPADIERALASQADNLFLMGGNVQGTIAAVKRTKAANKRAFVHLDLIKGLSSVDRESISFAAEYIGADGIISPKAHMVAEAKKAGLYSILHLFVLDSLALESGLQLAASVEPDAVELMPGLIPKVIRRFADTFEHMPVIASGLIQTVEEVRQCLEAGATALSVSESTLWSLTFEELNDE